MSDSAQPAKGCLRKKAGKYFLQCNRWDRRQRSIVGRRTQRRNSLASPRCKSGVALGQSAAPSSDVKGSRRSLGIGSQISDVLPQIQLEFAGLPDSPLDQDGNSLLFALPSYLHHKGIIYGL